MFQPPLALESFESFLKEKGLVLIREQKGNMGELKDFGDEHIKVRVLCDKGVWGILIGPAKSWKSLYENYPNEESLWDMDILSGLFMEMYESRELSFDQQTKMAENYWDRFLLMFEPSYEAVTGAKILEMGKTRVKKLFGI